MSSKTSIDSARTGTIYVIKNKINDKVYVGQTIQKVSERFKQHIKIAKTKKSNQFIHKAMLKYGFENFFFEVLEEAEEKYLNEKEEFYVAQFDSLANGYNLAPGGQKWRRKPITLDESTIGSLYKEGISTRTIAQQLGVSSKTIAKELRRTGIQLRTRHHNLPDKTVLIENREDVVRKMLFEDKLSIREIARRLGVSDKAVRKWIRKYEFNRM